MLKKCLFLAIPLMFALSSQGLCEESRTDVSLRFSEHEGFSRLVFEAENESLIKDAAVAALKNQIRVQFPAPFNLNAKGRHGLDVSRHGQTVAVNLPVPFKIKVARLSSPPRLSIDILSETTDQKSGQGGAGSPETTKNLRIVIDPGHGGYDAGIISGDLKEKDIALSLSRGIEALLIKKNKTVFSTRKTDQSLSIFDRALFANRKSPDIFISVHVSGGNNFVIYNAPLERMRPDAPAAEAYDLMHRQRRYAEKSRALAESIGKAIKDEFKADVIYREMALPLLNSVGGAAIMIEMPDSFKGAGALQAGLPEAILKGMDVYASRQ